MEAVITAGLSETEKHAVKNTPTSLITIDHRTIIEQQVQIMKDCGIQRLTVVTGALETKIQDLFAKTEKSGMILRIMANPQFDSTGKAFSFLYGLLGIDNDVVYMDEGALYEPRAIQDLIETGKRLTIGIKNHLSKDGMYVAAHQHSVVEMGVNLEKSNIIGEYAGVALIPQRCLLDLRCKLHTLFKSPYRLTATFEEAIQAAVSSRTKVDWFSLSDYTGGIIGSQRNLKKIRADWMALQDKKRSSEEHVI